MDRSQISVIILCVILLAAYAVGALYNRRRAKSILTWITAGLSPLGKAGEFRWHSPLHSAARLDVANVKAPFRTVQVLFVLEPRENLLVWLPRLLRGRRDELILRADLRLMPLQEFEVGRRGSRGLKTYIETQDEPYTTLPGNEHFDLAYRGKSDPEANARLQAFLAKYPRAIMRLSLQRKSVHLMLRADLEALRKAPLDEFFDALRVWLR